MWNQYNKNRQVSACNEAIWSKLAKQLISLARSSTNVEVTSTNMAKNVITVIAILEHEHYEVIEKQHMDTFFRVCLNI